jgi:perosamine synthetase
MRLLNAFEQLEEEFSKYTGMHCVAVASGTAALHIALETMQLSKHARVAVPDLTMIACPRAVAMAGLRPMFIDCNPDNLLMDLSKIPLTMVDVIMPVHIYGRVIPLGRGFENHIVIEDMAEAHGVLPHFGSQAACWSFYKNKIVHGEEGGMVAFRSPAHADKARSLRSLGFTPAHDFQHVPRGVNARLSNLHAAPILDSFRKMGHNLRIRERVANDYDRFLPKCWRMPRRDVDWVYDVRIGGMSHTQQDELVGRLRRKGIEARHCFKPCTSQEEFIQGAGGCNKQSHAYFASKEVIYLPLNEFMTPDDVCNIADELILAANDLGLY